ncbi:class I SAM-dependent methyltransferase [Chitinophaga pendula]|uniref:class I SAM-dependent methyltransferase n=1 Tax=Chitinophaga TaxID=79328 RepID=UPI000BB0526E|nr:MULTISPECIES: class I SAM-dependent methyltransferase [Chitinophaga]ASZ12863.1 SAM-dependent methyltransferase [Chitinophaga sp. MD30]UCJ09506.1 class I SAM-dependent methyltransferase [Chitinophaga pendula]
MKENKYDDARFFSRYGKMQRSQLGLAGAGEWHALRHMLPTVAGKDVLDLGCGFGWHCRYVMEHGAGSVVGIDISEKMLARAREINSMEGITYMRQAIEDVKYPPERFDVVFSSLAFHYLASFDDICRHVYEWLRPCGHFVFSVEHPVFTAAGGQDWVYDEQGVIRHWPVDRYFEEGARQAAFLGTQVIKYHRTLTTYLQGLLRQGFYIREVIEPAPSEEMLQSVEGMRDELRRPMMLLIAAEKPKKIFC